MTKVKVGDRIKKPVWPVYYTVHVIRGNKLYFSEYPNLSYDIDAVWLHEPNPIEEAKKLLEDAGYGVTPPPEPIVVERWIVFYHSINKDHVLSSTYNTKEKAENSMHTRHNKFIGITYVKDEF